MRVLFIGLLVMGSLTGCLSSRPLSHSIAPNQVTTFYDYQLYTPTGEAVSLQTLPTELKQADVILIGEWHTHSGIHRFQTELLNQVSSTQRQVALSMEQFSRDTQTSLNHYLDNKIGEQFLKQQTRTWPNYESDYRPLIELAKHKQIPVIASNAPKDIVRCIGREGIDYLDKLNKEERQWVAETINTQNRPYKDKFMSSMHHGQSEQTERQYSAQITWDETMAESITQYLTQFPDSQVVHIAGNFHVEKGLGIKQSILDRNPALNIIVISPTEDISNQYSDYQLHVLPTPIRYQQKNHQLAAFKQLSHRNKSLICK
ncbi:ChaN family lipoprotein [Vibrio sagamiensis]|uniref:Haem-binding uptake Tiki superfamily ChaN domain-containing protein n=1 Tax=Vibrio sagamiensis NBRC 104589 TaxID=1219064 RepID=A0A511QAV6_9VIBR|nr:ChaN family lipoprotein [Vibrio sagamiensis]PNQ68377.1 hypothetical protein C1141_07215 [Vibrio agarivorans]GEM74439.1 hypothetical protein VSA01S_05510 [Vibrio sagamiensis NBRC 104589]